jgi:hypothetical protein
MTVGVKAHTTRGVNYPQIGAVADLDEIVIIQKDIRHRRSFAPKYPGKGLVHHLAQSVGIHFVYEELGAGGSLYRLVSGGVIRMPVGIDDMGDPVFQAIRRCQNPIGFKSRIDQGTRF